MDKKERTHTHKTTTTLAGTQTNIQATGKSKKKRKEGNQLRSNVRNLDLNRENMPTFRISIFRELKTLDPWKPNASCLIFVPQGGI